MAHHVSQSAGSGESRPTISRRKPIPEFRSEAEERAFWAAPNRDSTEYLDWSKARVARFPKIKLSTRKKVAKR